jgi:hypothetical protein
VVADPVVVAQVAEMLTADLERSRLIEGDELASKSFPFRVAARGAYLLAPIL